MYKNYKQTQNTIDSTKAVKVNGFNKEYQIAELDAKVTNLQSYSQQKYLVAKELELAEDEKDKSYVQRLGEVENETFNPIICTLRVRRTEKAAVI